MKKITLKKERRAIRKGFLRRKRKRNTKIMRKGEKEREMGKEFKRERG
jgi:hypothetical protein